MTKRIERETLYIRHNFTPDERLKMGDDLAAAYNRQEDIDAEESVVKAQFKERRSTVEQSIGSLSRNLANQFEMRNVECRLEYDKPNPNEVSYVRVDNGEVVKTRPFTESERQQDLPLSVEVVSEDQSEENIKVFFDKPAETDSIEGEDVADKPALGKPDEPTIVAAPAPEPPKPAARKKVDPNSPEAVAEAKKNLSLM